jgi:hypothetical protein
MGDPRDPRGPPPPWHADVATTNENTAPEKAPSRRTIATGDRRLE